MNNFYEPIIKFYPNFMSHKSSASTKNAPFQSKSRTTRRMTLHQDSGHASTLPYSVVYVVFFVFLFVTGFDWRFIWP